jgi:ATP-binding cassette subfamily G (WHITE) protein 2 (SNQ2)
VIRPPQTATEFVEHFKKSKLGKLSHQEIEAYKAEFVNKSDRADVYRQGVQDEMKRPTAGR